MSGSEEGEDQQQEESVMMSAPHQRPGANTGPKGVQADYADAKQKMELKHRLEAQEAWADVQRMMMDLKSIQSGAKEEEKRSYYDEDEQRRSSEEDDEDDDAFMREYREKRLAEVRARARQVYRPTFGALTEVHPDNFVREVDNEHPDVYVVVHMTDVNIEHCQQLNRILGTLAVRYPHTRFIKVNAAAAMKVDSIALPTVVVFKAGQQILTWVRFLDQISPVSEDTVALFLIEHNVIEVGSEERQQMQQQVKRATDVVDPMLLMQLTDLLN